MNALGSRGILSFLDMHQDPGFRIVWFSIEGLGFKGVGYRASGF